MVLDYKQIPFEMDGQTGLLHEVNVLPGGDFEIPIRVPINSPGVHDLVVIAFADPYNGSLDPQFRSSFDIDLVGRRAQIISFGESTPAKKSAANAASITKSAVPHPSINAEIIVTTTNTVQTT